MKQFKQFIVNLVVGFVLLNIFGALFCTGSAYPFCPLNHDGHGAVFCSSTTLKG